MSDFGKDNPTVPEGDLEKLATWTNLRAALRRAQNQPRLIYFFPDDEKTKSLKKGIETLSLEEQKKFARDCFFFKAFWDEAMPDEIKKRWEDDKELVKIELQEKGEGEEISVGVYLEKLEVNEIGRIAEAKTKFAPGDISVTVEYSSKDEYFKNEKTFNTFLKLLGIFASYGQFE